MRIELAEETLRLVNREHEGHSLSIARRRQWRIEILHCGLKLEQVAETAPIARSRVPLIVKEQGLSGIEALLNVWRGKRPMAELAPFEAQLRRASQSESCKNSCRSSAAHRHAQWAGAKPRLMSGST